jgi:ABC-2 type transport system ATP-binding protein
LLILDEPTSGLDPVGRREVRDLIVDLRVQGVTVILNSHILSEIEWVCDEVAILDLGKLVWRGRPDAMEGDRIQVTADVAGVTPAALEAVRVVAPDLVEAAGHLRFTVADSEAIADVVAILAANGARLYALKPERPSLEDLFVRLVEGRDA